MDLPSWVDHPSWCGSPVLVLTSWCGSPSFSVSTLLRGPHQDGRSTLGRVVTTKTGGPHQDGYLLSSSSVGSRCASTGQCEHRSTPRYPKLSATHIPGSIHEEFSAIHRDTIAYANLIKIHMTPARDPKQSFFVNQFRESWNRNH